MQNVTEVERVPVKVHGGLTAGLAISLISVYLCASVASTALRQGGDDSRYRELREAMVRDQIAAARGSGAPAVRDERVLEAMRSVPRHLFVPKEQMAFAYEDRPLPIGHRQTISQPYIVAKMTELAQPKKEHVALEIGTGSGYQAAVLAKLVKKVCTIEIVEPLGREAGERLRALGFSNVTVRIGDGYAGWPEEAPFDIIIVTAAPEKVPPALIEELKPGGRMVLPMGPARETQILAVVTKGTNGPHDYSIERIMPVAFVPMVPGKKN